MSNINKAKQDRYKLRQRRTRSKMTGTASKPRLSVFRSLKHISAQAIDDVKGATLAAVSDKGIKVAKATKSDIASIVGQNMAKALQAKKITEIVFDKGAYKYHGRVKALAEGIRKEGIKF